MASNKKIKWTVKRLDNIGNEYCYTNKNGLYKIEMEDGTWQTMSKTMAKHYINI